MKPRHVQNVHWQFWNVNCNWKYAGLHPRPPQYPKPKQDWHSGGVRESQGQDQVITVSILFSVNLSLYAPLLSWAFLVGLYVFTCMKSVVTSAWVYWTPSSELKHKRKLEKCHRHSSNSSQEPNLPILCPCMHTCVFAVCVCVISHGPVHMLCAMFFILFYPCKLA